MPSPDFSPEETALLAQLRRADGSWLAFPLAYLLPSGLLVAFGFAYAEPAAHAAAFAVIAGFTVWMLRHQAASGTALRSILHKYEKALQARDAG
jgi:hypothetical protein